jgi:hypothetical protein
MTCLRISTRLLNISTIFKIKGFLSFTVLNCQQVRKRGCTDHEFTLIRRGNELALASALKIELADGNRRE